MTHADDEVCVCVSCCVLLVGKQAPIHNSAPTFEEQGKSQEILVTGIKVTTNRAHPP